VAVSTRTTNAIVADHDPASEDADREDRRRQPSLRRYPASELSDAYVGGRLRAADETGIDFTLFPADCPFTIDQVLDSVFIPDCPDSADQSLVTHPLRNIA